MSKSQSIEEKRYMEWKENATQDERDEESELNIYVIEQQELRREHGNVIESDRREELKGSKWGEQEHILKFEDLMYKFFDFNYKNELVFELTPLLYDDLPIHRKRLVSIDTFFEMVRTTLQKYLNVLTSIYVIGNWTKTRLGSIVIWPDGMMGMTRFHIQTEEMPRRYVDYVERNIPSIVKDLKYFAREGWEEVPFDIRNLFKMMEDRSFIDE